MCPEQARPRPIRPGARLLCLIALFVARLLPFSQSFFHWYTGERRYTNPTWLVAASYRMCGIDLWAGRLPFILAGARRGLTRAPVAFRWVH